MRLVTEWFLVPRGTGLQLMQFNNPASSSKITSGKEMKKQINPSIKAQLLRGAFYLLPLVAVCLIPFALGQRTTTKQSAVAVPLLLGSTPVSSLAPEATPFTFDNTGSLTTARARHTATLLPNGKVLLAGGFDSSGDALTSAELYDPGSGTWTATGSLSTARYHHTATLLPNGKVLVAGGQGTSTNAIASAELYDPASGTWTVTGSLNTARARHSATLLPNGKVLVAGGNDISSNALASAELYDSTSGSWTFTGSLNSARYVHTATLLPNGKVLVAGGVDNTGN